MTAQPIVEAARRHVIADVSDLDAALLDDLGRCREIVDSACSAGGATVLDLVSHHFTPQGVTVLALLAESHASLHTWPEVGCAFVDVFTCGSVDPAEIVQLILSGLGEHTARTAIVTT